MYVFFVVFIDLERHKSFAYCNAHFELF